MCPKFHAGLAIRIRIVMGSWIRTRIGIKVKGWIPIRIKVKILEL
jgi:hypothetical protein